MYELVWTGVACVDLSQRQAQGADRGMVCDLANLNPEPPCRPHLAALSSSSLTAAWPDGPGPAPGAALCAWLRASLLSILQTAFVAPPLSSYRPMNSMALSRLP